MLYCGPLVLKGLLPDEKYNHFLLFDVAIRILCSNQLCQKFKSQAENYLQRFVLLTGKLYRSQSLVLNLHSLIHLVHDVEFFKCLLSEVTAFPFENCVGKIKKLIHSGRNPLQQLCKILSEQFSIEKVKVTILQIFQILNKKKAYVKMMMWY